LGFLSFFSGLTHDRREAEAGIEAKLPPLSSPLRRGKSETIYGLHIFFCKQKKTLSDVNLTAFLASKDFTALRPN
jgi:hypothetical protein